MACDPTRFPRIDARKLIEQDGRRYLWGGPSPEQHFDITEFDLEPSQLFHGIGREAFAALLEPAFEEAAAADRWLAPDEPVLVLKVGDDVRIYPRSLLNHHEVVNDVVGGRPVFAAYCVLADLGAVYDRVVDGHAFTFAVSGYTYADPAVWECRNAFVLWDRDSESLWWPPLGRAVAGPMRGTPLPLFERHAWAHSRWSEARRRFPQARVLMPDQDFPRPQRWPRYQPQSAGARPGGAAADPSLAHWGVNPRLPE